MAIVNIFDLFTGEPTGGTLTLTSYPPAYGGLPNPLCTSCGATYNFDTTALPGGEYEFTYTVGTAPCTDSETAVLTIVDKPFPIGPLSSQYACTICGVTSPVTFDVDVNYTSAPATPYGALNWDLFNPSMTQLATGTAVSGVNVPISFTPDIGQFTYSLYFYNPTYDPLCPGIITFQATRFPNICSTGSNQTWCPPGTAPWSYTLSNMFTNTYGAPPGGSCTVIYEIVSAPPGSTATTSPTAINWTTQPTPGAYVIRPSITCLDSTFMHSCTFDFTNGAPTQTLTVGDASAWWGTPTSTTACTLDTVDLWVALAQPSLPTSGTWTLNSSPTGFPITLTVDGITQSVTNSSYPIGVDNTPTITTFPAAGTYVFRYTLSDGTCTAYTDLTIVVTAATTCTYNLKLTRPSQNPITATNYQAEPGVIDDGTYVSATSLCALIKNCGGTQSVVSANKVISPFKKMRVYTQQLINLTVGEVMQSIRIYRDQNGTESSHTVNFASNLTGPCGTVLLADLTYTGANLTAVRTAVTTCIKNYVATNFGYGNCVNSADDPNGYVINLAQGAGFYIRTRSTNNPTDAMGINLSDCSFVTSMNTINTGSVYVFCSTGEPGAGNEFGCSVSACSTTLTIAHSPTFGTCVSPNWQGCVTAMLPTNYNFIQVSPIFTLSGTPTGPQNLTTSCSSC